ncbi:MAG: hypothetical protein NVV73_19415 [Cellvibrionaceae bacterium]|nr:hypothetical protein [Cellvibrionaceae bacterium]
MASRSCLWICLLLLGLVACGDKSAHAPSPAEPAPPVAAAPAEPNKLPMAVLDIAERNRNGKNGIAVTLATEVDPGQDIQPYFQIQVKRPAMSPAPG